ncbi:beta-hydroxyacyl-ACP dehydratase [Lysobacter sp. K5869]|uniref:polyketide synthase dehydratase domain-containing protein n=1 Tax=Lysobacter sp. K5869 TaxID=2820808 RepID=UPI001C060236|nr:polyketide synthase dehydratase domain-containing protein [Lysobacter sp. K5869]QWP77298.1 beta-hydroxyacyl-ACP dehydratase [Lysobacter sp. K5869]
MNFVVPADHPCLPGHFPGRPLVPGVVLLERVLEAVQAQHGESSGLRLPQVKFLQPLLPGEAAQVELEPLAPSRWRFRVRRGEDLLASGEIVADGASTHTPQRKDANA